MKNIYDIRKEQNLVYILSSENRKKKIDESKFTKVAIAINLYYLDGLDEYIKYIKNIPAQIDVYIFSSNERVLEKLYQDDFERNNISITVKENRGRDISALLVSFREITLKYEYICFLHDKKAKNEYTKLDVEKWNENLWENTLSSPIYIENVIDILESKKEIGLLVPPEPEGDFKTLFKEGLWANDFEITKSLAERLHLKTDIRKDKQPITIGTVFWARTQALKKLLQLEWKYTDFPEEPMADDGEINHAVERILGYIVQDAGFMTGTTMTEAYAAKQFLTMRENNELLLEVLKDVTQISTYHMAYSYFSQKKRIVDFFGKYKKVFIYGAGEYGTILSKCLKQWGLVPEGFLVTCNKEGKVEVAGHKLYELKDIDITDESLGVIIATSYVLREEIEQVLIAHNCKNYIQGYDYEN